MPPIPATNAELAHARELFLGGDHEIRGVRGEIQASWHRSQSLAVLSDQLDPPFVQCVNRDSLLSHSAAPVLASWQGRLSDEPVSMVLTDPQGMVLQRICTDSFLQRKLDDIFLLPGFSYAESAVGTNGIGTAIETGSPTLVHGNEHFTQGLSVFTCAAAIIRHPITGAPMGVIDISTSVRTADQSLVDLAVSTARQIEEQLLARVSSHEVALMRDYLATCHHTGGSVLAFSDKLVMMNSHAQDSYSHADQSALLALVRDASGSSKPMTLLTELPSGETARLEFRPTMVEDIPAGGVFRIQSHAVPTAPPSSRAPAAVSLPGVAGASGNWQRVCRAVLASRRRNEWSILEGEAGAGKFTIAQAVHQALDPRATLRVLDCRDVEVPGWFDQLEEALDLDAGTLILRRVHLLAAESVAQVSELLLTHTARRDSGPWVVMTLDPQPPNPAVESQLLPQFPHTVQVPPLRHHLEDLEKIVPYLLRKQGREIDLSRQAMNQLHRLTWPGNVEQLRQVLARASRLRRSGTLQVNDLPPECRAMSRRQLSRMEALERDAIISALDAHDGHKDRAAESLGMSRATIYRKIKDFGITAGR